MVRHPPLPCIHAWPLEPTAPCPQVPEAFSGPAKGPQDAGAVGSSAGLLAPGDPGGRHGPAWQRPPRRGPGQAGLPAMAGVSGLPPGPVGLSALRAPSWHSGLGSSGHPVHSCAGPCPLPSSTALSGQQPPSMPGEGHPHGPCPPSQCCCGAGSSLRPVCHRGCRGLPWGL